MQKTIKPSIMNSKTLLLIYLLTLLKPTIGPATEACMKTVANISSKIDALIVHHQYIYKIPEKLLTRSRILRDTEICRVSKATLEQLYKVKDVCFENLTAEVEYLQNVRNEIGALSSKSCLQEQNLRMILECHPKSRSVRKWLEKKIESIGVIDYETFPTLCW